MAKKNFELKKKFSQSRSELRSALQHIESAQNHIRDIARWIEKRDVAQWIERIMAEAEK